MSICLQVPLKSIFKSHTFNANGGWSGRHGLITENYHQRIFDRYKIFTSCIGEIWRFSLQLHSLLLKANLKGQVCSTHNYLTNSLTQNPRSNDDLEGKKSSGQSLAKWDEIASFPSGFQADSTPRPGLNAPRINAVCQMYRWRCGRDVRACFSSASASRNAARLS